MSVQDWKKVKKILGEVLELQAAERQKFLNRIEAPLRAEIESLLAVFPRHNSLRTLNGHRPFENIEDDLREIYKAVLKTDPPLPSVVILENEKALYDK
jgi:hypothetical protein